KPPIKHGFEGNILRGSDDHKRTALLSGGPRRQWQARRASGWFFTPELDKGKLIYPRLLPGQLRSDPTMSIDLTDMTDEQLYELIEAAQTELGRLQTREVFDRELAEVVQKGRESGIIETPEAGEEWQAGRVYSLGDVV